MPSGFTKIPVFVGPRIIDMCDSISVRRYTQAPNAQVIRKRKTGKIVQVNLASHGDDSALRSLTQDASPTYKENLEVHTVLVLKRYDPRFGDLVRWGENDCFNPRRFNPDRVETVRMPELPRHATTIPITAALAEAPHVPTARFSIRRDPSRPWSAANSREIY